jgi:hypothetical protein
MKSPMSILSLARKSCRARDLGLATPDAVQWQGSEHDSQADCHMAHTVNLWGEGVITTNMPSCNGGRSGRYRIRSDNG